MAESRTENPVHTLSEVQATDQDNPHVILNTSETTNQSEYVRLLESRLAELEKTVMGLVESKKADNDGDGKGSENGSEEKSETGEEKEEKKADEQGGEGDEQEIRLPIIPEARKVNISNFTNRFPNQTHLPVVEALMVATTETAAYTEDRKFTEMLKVSSTPDGLQSMHACMEKNSYKADAWIARIRINSVSLVKIIMKAVNPEAQVETSLTFNSPFLPLTYNHDKIKAILEEMEASPNAGEIRKEDNADEESAHVLLSLKCYVEFMESEIIQLYPSEPSKIRFEGLSSVFQLGDSIYVPSTAKSSKSDPEMLAHRNNQRLWRLYRTLEDDDFFKLKCYAIDHDGESYVCIKRSFTIDRFTGEQDIPSLLVFPLRHAENAEQIRTECIADGQKFIDYWGLKLLSHNGWALEPDSKDESDKPLQFITSDVVVDFAEALKAHPNWKPSWKFPKVKAYESSLKDYAVWHWKISDKERLYYKGLDENYLSNNDYARMRKMEYCTKKDHFLSSMSREQGKNYKLTEEDIELLPRRLFSYVLQDRKFVAVDVRNLKPVEDHWTYSPNLIIDQGHESMLRALVNSHFKRKEIHDSLGVYSINQDVISNKGRGLVILLYGVPGVGKTSTAENIAHSWKRPLLPITCGDLGTQPSDVEASLKEIFRLAQLWDCILLLDEAEVFLSERTPAALERNALVSVFLRMLEYYTGILFLTTNLPGSIDEAFKSRIHISLYYPHLDRDTTIKIWDMNLRRLAAIEGEHALVKEEQPLSIDVKGIRRFAKKHYRVNEDGKGRWNGRQIRNAFLIASALAHFEKETGMSNQYDPASAPGGVVYDIKPNHFEVVANASMGFERYLLQTRGRTAGESAFQRGLRADFILSSPDKIEEASSVHPHDEFPGNRFPESDPSAMHQSWESPAQRTNARLVQNKRRSYNAEQWDQNQVNQPLFSPETQYYAQQQSQKMRANVDRRAPSPMNISPQGQPPPWTPSKHPSQKSLLHVPLSGNLAMRDEDTDYDSDDHSCV